MRGQNKNKGYNLTIWADGYRRWHGRVDFTIPLGNTGEAEALFGRAERYAKRNLSRIIRYNDSVGKGYRIRYKVTANKTEPGSGRLLSVTWAEA